MQNMINQDLKIRNKEHLFHNNQQFSELEIRKKYLMKLKFIGLLISTVNLVKQSGQVCGVHSPTICCKLLTELLHVGNLREL